MSGAPIVIKLGGAALAGKDALEAVADAIASAVAGAAPTVIVHGGGSETDAMLDRLGIESPKIGGLRATSDEAIGPVAGVLAGSVNKKLTSALRSAGVDAVGLCLGDGGTIAADHADDPSLGLVGVPVGGDASLVSSLLAAGRTPVLSSIAFDHSGGLLNINADDAAVAVAELLEASRLVLATDAPGVLDAHGEPITSLDASAIHDLIESGVISAGMRPKVLGALRAADRLSTPVLITHWRSLGDAEIQASGTLVEPRAEARRRREPHAV